MVAYNSSVEPEMLDEEDCSVEWTDVSLQPTYVSGEQVEEIMLLNNTTILLF